MFDAIARFFSEPHQKDHAIEPRVAVAALLVHLAAVDGTTGSEEKKVIASTLSGHFDLDGGEVKKLMAEAARRDADSVDLYQFTSALAGQPESERIEIIRMMWQVVFADKRNHELEDNMVWRVAELIGVSSRQRTQLRQEMRRTSQRPK